jgi:serine/threonine-protein kinase
MDATRWQRIQTLFHEAADLSGAERDSFLIAACGEDVALVSEVMAMLEADHQGNSLLDRDMTQVAHQMLSGTDSPVPGTKEFGPYNIKSVLGEGGMGVVYLAERRDLGNLVAIKILRDAWLSPARRERFASEQRLLAQLNHPSIARLYDADTLPDGTPWFVMEYVEGLPLTDYCQRHKCSIARRLQLFRQVCEAVQYAHAQAVIHRDLKPSNIFVKSDGGVRLLDFGIAKQIESLDTPVDQTRTLLRLMTPAYAAPEQIRGNHVGVQTDVYSLGVILYQLLAGRLPFDLANLTPAEAASIAAGHEPGKPSATAEEPLRLEISKTAWVDLEVLCLTAMHKDPQRRYRSAEALIRDIDHYLAGEPLEARRDTLRYRTAKFVRRNQRAVASAALVFAIIVGLVTFFTVRLEKARDNALADAARTQRIQQFMTNLFQGGDEAAGPADNLRVVTLLDRGVQQAQSLSSDPKIQAELYQSLGGIYEKLGKFDQADSLLRSSLEQRKSLFGADSSEVAESLVALGQLRSDQARLEEAEQLTRQGVEMTKRHLPADHPAVAKATLAFGSVLAQRGTYDQAIQALGEAVRIDSLPAAAPTDLAASLSALAAAQYSAGRYDVSESLYRQLLEMHRQLYGERHPLVADDLGNIGSIQEDLGYYQQAEQSDRQALAITEAYYGKNHPKTATELTMLGRSLEYQNRFDEAVDNLQQALAIQEHLFGPVHPAVADTVNELGNVASMREHLDEAEVQFRRVVDIYRQVYGDHHYLVAIGLSNVASVRMDKKDYAGAEELFRDVVRRFTETLAADNVNTGTARIKLGRTLLREAKYQEATVETLAGYDILIKQTSPSTSYIRAARKDLVADYEALKEPEKAEKFRAQLNESAAKPATVARKN